MNNFTSIARILTRYSLAISLAAGLLARAAVPPAPARTYAEWAAREFAPAELAAPLIADPTADPDGSGVTNLLRYAFGLRARGPVAAPVAHTTVTEGGLTFPAVRFATVEAGTDLTYTVEASADLVEWTPLARFAATAAGTHTVRDVIAIGDGARRFLRVRASLPLLDRASLTVDRLGTYMPDDRSAGLTDPTALEDVSGNITYRTPQTIRNKRFLGTVSVAGPDITFINCWFAGRADYSDTIETGLVNCTHVDVARAQFIDCLFSPQRPMIGIDGIKGRDYTLWRCKLVNTVDGCKIYPSELPAGSPVNVRIWGCYFADLTFYCPDPGQKGDNKTHNDCIQIATGGGTDIEIIGNNFRGFYNRDPHFPGHTEPNDALLPPVNPVGARADAGNVYYGLPESSPNAGLHVTAVVMLPDGTKGYFVNNLKFNRNFVDGGTVALNYTGATAGAAGVFEIRDNTVGTDFRIGADFFLLARTDLAIDYRGNRRFDGTPFTVRKKG